MKTLIVLMLLCGCGGGVLLEPVRKSPLVAGPIDCAAVCVSVEAQLIRDFGFTDAQVDCTQPSFAAANDCESCRGVFRTKFGVELAQCL